MAQPAGWCLVCLLMSWKTFSKLAVTMTGSTPRVPSTPACCPCVSLGFAHKNFPAGCTLHQGNLSIAVRIWSFPIFFSHSLLTFSSVSSVFYRWISGAAIVNAFYSPSRNQIGKLSLSKKALSSWHLIRLGLWSPVSLASVLIQGLTLTLRFWILLLILPPQVQDSLLCNLSRAVSLYLTVLFPGAKFCSLVAYHSNPPPLYQ